MKKVFKKRQTSTKGMSSAVLLSIAIHAGLFLLAGMLVVFTVVKKEEQKFEPPKAVERPKMKLKKPKVKVKKTSRPKKAKHILAKVNPASMPDIQLPELGGTGGEGFGGGVVGGFDMMPDLEEVTIFGSGQTIGNDFKCTIYDFKRTRQGKKRTVAMGSMDLIKQKEYVERFIKSGWRSSSLGQFYRSPRSLYTTSIMVPPVISPLCPWAFGEREMGPYQYMVHYKGQLVHRDGIRFRFVVMGDNFLLIRLDGKVVMDYKNQFEHVLDVKESKPLNYHLGHWYAYATDWIELEAGVPKEMEVLWGEYWGGLTSIMIAVEVEGVDYPHAPSPQDNPVLPIFKTAELTPDQIDAIYEFLWEGHLSVTNGPVFNDYEVGSLLPDADPQDATPPAEADITDGPERGASPVEPALRTWTLNSGKHIEAEYVAIIGGKVVLKNARGKVAKVPPEDFSEEDAYLLDLLNPPELVADFKKKTEQFKVLYNPELGSANAVAQRFAGGVVIKQRDMKGYPYWLRLEMYVILDNYDGDNFILSDRQIETFSLTPENERRFELYGEKRLLRRYQSYGGDKRGEKYKGYMILVYDERGEIILQNLSHDWLMDIVDELKVLPIGRHFNKQGRRVHPPRPEFTSGYWEHPP